MEIKPTASGSADKPKAVEVKPRPKAEEVVREKEEPRQAKVAEDSDTGKTVNVSA